MRKLSGVSIIESKYCYNRWRVDASTVPYTVTSEVKYFSQPRDVDLYHLCGVYHKAGVPVDIIEADHKKYKESEPYEGLLKSVSDAVSEAVKKGNGICMSNGYCLYAPAIVGGIQRAVGTGKKIGVVWIDAHSDNRIIEESKDAVRFVGIPISSIVGQTYEEWRVNACGLKEPCYGKNVLVSDARMNDEICNDNMQRAGILHIDSADFENEKIWREEIGKLAERVDLIYLSVDVDILNSMYIPAYDKVVPGGHSMETVMRNIRIVMETNKVLAYSLFCVDFDHYERGGEWTYLSGMKLIAAGLDRWKYIPKLTLG